MAELHVQPKRNNYWWIWIILLIIIIAGIYYYFNYYNKNDTVENTTTTIDSSSVENNTKVDTSSISPAGDNLWSQVDFNSPDTTFSEINGSHTTIKSNSHFVIYSISDQSLFDNNNNEITNDGKKILGEVGASIQKRFPGPEVRILGQPDSVTSQDLTSQRAQAVSAFLVNSSKLNQNHVFVYHSGEPVTLPEKGNRVYIIVKR